MGSLLYALIVLGAAAAAGIHVGRNNPKDPYGYIRKKVKGYWNKIVDGDDDDDTPPTDDKPLTA